MNDFLKQLRDNIALVISIFVLCGMVAGVWVMKADSKDLQVLAMRVDQKIDSDRYKSLQERIWSLKDRMELFEPGRKERDVMKDEIRQLELELQELDRKMRQDR